jgi:hypothetical protein
MQASKKFACTRKEVIAMDWKKLTPEEKAKWLSQQKEDIRRTRVLIERFERAALKWLKQVEKTQNKA